MKKSSYPNQIKSLVYNASQNLKKAEISSSDLDSIILISHLLKKDKAWILTHPEFNLNNSLIEKYNVLIQQRASHKPIAYIISSKEFYGYDFFVNEQVLIPRPETEIMITMVLDNYSDKSQVKMIDIGTGSGAIGLAIAKNRPKWQITLSDISKPALKVAKYNANKLGMTKNINYLNYDLFPVKQNFDIICANLPYVPEYLSNIDISFEPKISLFAGYDGLDQYRRLFIQLEDLSDKPYAIFTESLIQSHSELSRIALKAGYRCKETKELIQYFTR